MKKANRPELPAELVASARAALHKVVAPLEGVQMAMLCTPDGFEIAALNVGSDLKVARLAAMAGSLMAMAGAVGREVGTDACSRITFETGDRVAVFQAVASFSPCILGLLIDSNALLGRVLWAASEVALELEGERA